MVFGLKRGKQDEAKAAPPPIRMPSPTPAPADERAIEIQPEDLEPITEEDPHMANIGKSITILGDVTGEEDLVIDGRVEGRVELNGHQLTVGPNGNIEGELEANEIIVVGHVRGDLQATERIEIMDSGMVEGDLTAPRLRVREGAVVNGRMNMSAPMRATPSVAPVKAQRPQPVTTVDQPPRVAAPKIEAPKIAAPKPEEGAKAKA